MGRSATCSVTVVNKDTTKPVCAALKDTLKPTIGLKFGGRFIHSGAATDKGVQGQSNPAHKRFMAEAATSGYAFVALAAAAVGVALLALGGKKDQSEEIASLV